MRLVLHIGQPKTGTTTLQKLLEDSHEALLREGVLHPTLSGGHSHKRLLPYLLGPERAGPNGLERLGGDPATALRRSEALWREVEAQCRAHAGEPDRVDTIVISAEHLFQDVPPERAVHYADAVHRLAEELCVVAYLRDPVSYFLSNVQQGLRRNARIRLPEQRASTREIVTSHERALDTRVRLRAFERDQLLDGNVVFDFAQGFLPQVEKLLRERYASDRNTTLSAEAMAVMQDAHRAAAGRRAGRRRRESRALWQALREVDPELPGFARPRLHGEVEESIVRQDPDLRWLADERGVRFGVIDYERAGQGGGRTLHRDLDVAEICPVDPARRAELEARARRRGSSLRSRLGL